MIRKNDGDTITRQQIATNYRVNELKSDKILYIVDDRQSL